MKSKIKLVLIFAAGLLLGTGATFIIIGKITQRQFATQYSTLVTDQAVLAIELRLNREQDIAQRIESDLPIYVLAIHQNKYLRDAPNSQQALWRVKEFYTVNSITIPAEISGILNALPPEPPASCYVK